MTKATYNLIRLALILLLVVGFVVVLALVLRWKTGRLIVKISPPEIQKQVQLTLTDEKRQPVSAHFIPQKDGTLIASLQPGRYVLEASHPDYVYQEKPILIWGGRSVLADFNLVKIPKIELLASKSRNLKNWFAGKGIVYQDLNKKKLMNISAGEANELTPPSFGEVEEIVWQPERNLAIIRKENGETGLYDFARYDLVHQEYHPWANDINSVTWRPDGERVIYVLKNKKEDSLIKANKDNSEPERLLDLTTAGLNNPQLVWSPSEDRIILVENDVYKFNVITKELTKIINEQNVSSLLFSPDGERMLFQSGEELKMADKEGKNIETIAKIKWGEFAFLNNNEIIYFSPEEADLPLFGYNLNTKQKRYFIYKIEEGQSAPEKIIVDDSKQKIYFLSDGDLYQLELVEAKHN